MTLLVRPLLLVLFLAGVVLPAAAQIPLTPAVRPQADRIAAHPDLRATLRLAGHVPTWANAANDAGPVTTVSPLRLTFVLTRSSERQAAFSQLLVDQQNPASLNYHRWLTPQEIGTLYGPTQNDLDALTNWLASQNLVVTETAPSRIFLAVEAPAAVVANALNTSFRNYNLRDPATGIAVPHRAAITNPAIPTVFAAIVSSINGLADIPEYPMHHVELAPRPAAIQIAPDGTSGSTGTHYIAPADFAVLYDLPTSSSGINGTGQRVAVMGRSRVDAIDISRFESIAGLPVNQPNVIVPSGAGDPGTTGTAPIAGTNPNDQAEATLDVDRVIATAPRAQVDLVIATSASGGIDTAAQYEVQTLRDPVMNISFSSCEANAGSTAVNFWDTLFSQAAAEGISTFVSSDDSGVAGCATAFATPPATQTSSINVICSSSFATCVGGTEFADFASPSAYWKPTNGTNLETAISYIPEGAWNEPTTTGGATTVAATGGGVSAFVPKPLWQTGTGVPADGFRDAPDVSFSASQHNGYFGCLNYAGADCLSIITFFSGTSAAAPGMAGIAALLNQKTGGAQGNLNPLLYRLANGSSGTFHDATPATSGVACSINTPSMCNNSTPGPTALTGGRAGYALTTGYDQATGLGSLNVANFLTASASAASISVSPASSSLTITAGATTGNTDLLTVNSFAYAGNATLGCTVVFSGSSTASSQPICNVNPVSVTLAANGSATSTLTIATSANPIIRSSSIVGSSSIEVASVDPVPHSAVPHAPLGRIALGSFLLLGLIPARRYRHIFGAGQSITVFLLFTGLGALSACSGSSTPPSPNPLLISTSGSTITAASSSIFAGATDIFSITVANTGFNSTVAPTGTVQLFANGALLPGTITLANGTANSTSIVFPNSGSYLITAVYSGDNNFSASTSAGVPLTVVPRGTTTGSYTITVNATTPDGLTASSTIALTVQ